MRAKIHNSLQHLFFFCWKELQRQEKATSQDNSLNLLYGPTASDSLFCVKDDFTAEGRRNMEEKDTHTNFQWLNPFPNTFPNPYCCDQSHAEACGKHLCLQDLQKPSVMSLPGQALSLHLGTEGAALISESLTDIKHMLLSARSFSLGLLTKRIRVTQSSVSIGKMPVLWHCIYRMLAFPLQTILIIWADL